MAVFWDEQGSGGILDGDGPDVAQRARWSGSGTMARPGGGRDGLPGAGGFGASRPGLGIREPVRHGGVGQAVESEILPRLLLGHRAVPARLALPGDWIAAPEQIIELAECSVRDEASAGDYIAELRAHGAGVESVYLDLLAPAARHLGARWEDDTLSFVDVTIGLLRLHQVLRALAPEFRAEAAPERPGRRALLVPAPGEQHTFGLSMVTEFFRRAGWGVWSGKPNTTEDLFGMVRGEWFAVVGFSVACDLQLDSLASCIRRVRSASRNPSIGVMVGGPVFVLHPELAVSVGADTTASDGRNAAFQAEGLLALQSRML
jgi:methanogenic corrinoid protein MtbC1